MKASLVLDCLQAVLPDVNNCKTLLCGRLHQMNKGLRLKDSLCLAENNSNMPGHTPLPEPVLLRLSVSLGNTLHCPVTNNQSRVFVLCVYCIYASLVLVYRSYVVWFPGMYGIDRCPTKITRFVFILSVAELCAMDQIFYTDEHVIQGVTLAASLNMMVIALLTEVFIRRITQSVYTAMIRHFTPCCWCVPE